MPDCPSMREAPSAINAARARERSRCRSATQRGYEVPAHRKTDQALRTGSEATDAGGECSRGYFGGARSVLGKAEGGQEVL
jgi:hypothetical protein